MCTTAVHNSKCGPRVTASFPGPGAQTWSTHRAVLIVLLGVLIAAAAWAVFGASPIDRLVAVVIAIAAAVGLVIAASRRLTVGPDGFVVRNLGGSRQIGWEAVRSVREVGSRRMGAAGATVEVDLVDDTLFVFGRTELGVDPRTVGPVLRRWWHRAGEQPADPAG